MVKHVLHEASLFVKYVFYRQHITAIKKAEQMTNISTRDKVIIIITGTRGVETLSTLALFSQQRDFGVAAVANGGHSTSNRALVPPIHISRKI